MKDIIKGLRTYLFGALFIAGLILIPLLLLKGGLWLTQTVYPLLIIIYAIALIVCVVIFLPLSLFQKTRAFSSIGILISSYIFGVTVWVWSFLLTYMLWGMLGLIIGLFIMGVGVVPVAILATLLNGEWSAFFQLVLLLVLTFGTRGFALYLAKKEGNISMLSIIRIITGILLVFALADNPYFYYQILRWVVCLVSGYTAFIAYKQKKINWVWVLVILAIIFNPIIPFYFSRETWRILDIFSSIIIIISVFKVKIQKIEIILVE